MEENAVFAATMLSQKLLTPLSPRNIEQIGVIDAGAKAGPAA